MSVLPHRPLIPIQCPVLPHQILGLTLVKWQSKEWNPCQVMSTLSGLSVSMMNVKDLEYLFFNEKLLLLIPEIIWAYGWFTHWCSRMDFEFTMTSVRNKEKIISKYFRICVTRNFVNHLQALDFRVPHSNTDSFRNSFFQRIADVWADTHFTPVE